MIRCAAGASREPAADHVVELLHYEGYADADDKFKTEMLEHAGADEHSAHYQQPAAEGPGGASARTRVRRADPNEYERTRF